MNSNVIEQKTVGDISMKHISILFFMLLGGFALEGQVTRHVVVNNINSSYDEHSPVLSPDGQRLYFTRKGHPSNIGGILDQGDIWYAEKVGDEWSTPIHGGDTLNHPGLNGVVGFSADGNRMYVLNFFNRKAQGEGKLKNGIAVTEKVGGRWGLPQLLNIRYFSNESIHLSATISRDEQILIMAMKSFETFGNEDLYVSFRQPDDSWSQPENMGEDLNTFGEEWAPFLASDNETLYFSSNGYDGFGSRDIFISKRSQNMWREWTKPVNLGDTLNTVGTEVSFFVPEIGRMAYFSSTQDSEGMGDIFQMAIRPKDQKLETAAQVVAPIEAKPQMVALTFQVLDNRTKSPVDAEVTMRFGNKEIGINTADLKEQNDKFIISLEQSMEVFVEIKADGYLSYKESFEVGASDVENKQLRGGATVEEFLLSPADVGTKMELENVLFERASARLSNLAVARKQMDELAQIMKDNPGMAIRLEGHTDNRGNAELLKELSLERVKTVRDYLVDQGIRSERIEVIGYGGEKPLYTSDDLSEREKNRRVEFVIIK